MHLSPGIDRFASLVAGAGCCPTIREARDALGSDFAPAGFGLSWRTGGRGPDRHYARMGSSKPAHIITVMARLVE